MSDLGQPGSRNPAGFCFFQNFLIKTRVDPVVEPVDPAVKPVDLVKKIKK
jgi:hypothetical protein